MATRFDAWVWFFVCYELGMSLCQHARFNVWALNWLWAWVLCVMNWLRSSFKLFESNPMLKIRRKTYSFNFYGLEIEAFLGWFNIIDDSYRILIAACMYALVHFLYPTFVLEWILHIYVLSFYNVPLVENTHFPIWSIEPL